MSFFKREKEMSKIARDLVSVYLYDDLHERFNEVCYCQCNSDKEERKITSEVFQNDGNPNYFYELLSILDDIVECSTCDAIPPHFRDTFKSKDDNFWNHFQTIKTDKEALKTLLNKFVDYLYIIVLFMGGEQQLIDAERKKKGLGYLIHNLHNDDYNPGIDDISEGLLFNAQYVQMFDTIIRYRNGFEHPKADPGFINGRDHCLLLFHNQTYDTIDEDKKKKAAFKIQGLMLVCLLHLIDYNKDILTKFISDNYHPVLSFDDKSDFDPSAFNDAYIDSLRNRVRTELRRNVGYLNDQNDGEIHLIDLHLHPTIVDGQPVVVDASDDENEIVSNNSGVTAQEVSMRSIANAPSRVSIILGHPGSGKSTLLHSLLQNLSFKWKDVNSVQTLPVYVECKNVSEIKDTLEEAVIDSFRRFVPFSNEVETLVSKHLQEQYKSGRVVFILDGLNELKLSNQNNFLDSVIDAIDNKYRNARFYITGRIYEFEKDVAPVLEYKNFHDFTIYQMKELSFEEDIERFFKDSGVSDEQFSLFESWTEGAQLRELLVSPLNLSMISSLVLHNDDNISMKSIHNRGELLDLFLKKKIRDKGTLSERESELLSFLQQLANELYYENTQYVLYDKLVQGRQEIADIVGLLSRLNIIRVEDYLGNRYLSFSIDTYQEFFAARGIAFAFVGNERESIAPRTLKQSLPAGVPITRLETLKMTVQLLSGGLISPLSARQDSLRFVREYYNSDTNLTDLAELVSSIPSRIKETSKDIDARYLVERWVLNSMISFRREHRHIDDLISNFNTIKTFVECAAKLSSELVYRELFSPYWMAILRMVVAEEFGYETSLDYLKSIELQQSLILNCSDSVILYRFVHSRQLDLIQLPNLFKKSLICFNKFKESFFSGISLYRQKILYAFINDWCDYSAIESGNVHDVQSGTSDRLLAQDSGVMLLNTKDLSFIAKHLNMQRLLDCDAVVSRRTLLMLLRNYSYKDRTLPRIIFNDNFNNLLRYSANGGSENMAMAIRFYLFRACYPPELISFIPKSHSALLNDKDRRDIYNLLEIPELRDIANSTYDMDIFSFLSEREDPIESKEGLRYEFYERKDNSVRVVIRDIDTDLKELNATINNKKLRIVDDSYESSVLYKFEWACIDNTVIEDVGLFCMGDKSFPYKLPIGGTTAYYYTYDDSIAKLLRGIPEICVGYAQKCSVKLISESPRQLRRVLTIGGADINVGYYGDIQFYDNSGIQINIDKTIRPSALLGDPKMFVPVSDLPSKQCSCAPYKLLGQNESFAWIVTDKLVNKDRYYGCGVRESGSDSVGFIFDDASPWQIGFVELSFRSTIPYSFPPFGLLQHVFADGTLESIPYIYCTNNGRRSVMRILDNDFVTRIRDHQTRLSYMEDEYRFGRISLTLDYVDFLPFDKLLSLWRLKRNINIDIPLSGNGFIEIIQSHNNAFKLNFTEETRNCNTSQLECYKICCPNKDNEAVFATFSKDARLLPGLYISPVEGSAHLRILSMPRVQSWVAECEIRTIKRLGQAGVFSFCDSDLSFYYIRPILNENKLYIIPISDKEDNTFEFSQDLLRKSSSLVIHKNDGQDSIIGILSKTDLILSEHPIRLFSVEIPLNISSFECDKIFWSIKYALPINNEKHDSALKSISLIKTSDIPYHVAGKESIRISKPQTTIDGLWVSVNDSNIHVPVSIIEENRNDEYGIERICINVKTKDGRMANLGTKGVAHFFRKEEKHFIPVQVGYNMALKIIELKTPERYPAQICDVIVEELNGLNVLNESIIDFFISLSRSYLLLQNKDLLEQIKGLGVQNPLFNICRVITPEKDNTLYAFSFKYKRVVQTTDTVLAKDEKLKEGDFIVIEANNKVTKIDSDAVLNVPVFGNPTYDVTY